MEEQKVIFKKSSYLTEMSSTHDFRAASTHFTPLILPTNLSDEFESPRQYQTDILQKAKYSNIIAVLDTGAGKTLISLLLLKYMKTLKEAWKLSVFLVPTIPLVSQQAMYLRNNSSLRVANVWGGVQNGSSMAIWANYVESCDVLVMTSSILLNALDHGHMNLNQIDLIIFDECHHARSDHPYNLIMRIHYSKCESAPKIFGMTASPCSAKETINDSIRNLENNLHCTLMSLTHSTVLQTYVSRPLERIVYFRNEDFFEPPGLYFKLQASGLRHFLEREVGECMVLSDLLGPWGAERALEMAVEGVVGEVRRRVRRAKREEFIESSIVPDIIVESAKRKAEDGYQGMTFKKRDTEPALDPIDGDVLIQQSYDLMQQFKLWGPKSIAPLDSELSGKVNKLVDILLEFREESMFFCGIVFCQQRLMAKVLQLVVSRHPKLSFVKSGLLLGHGALAKTSGMTVEMQQDIVTQFRNGSLNLLIATQVAEEGLDIKPCNCVIRFDMQEMNLISYIQSRGRARHQSSQFIVLAEEGDETPKCLLEYLKATESGMKTTILVNEKEQVEVQDELKEGEHFRVEGTNAIAHLLNSVKILGEFVSTLRVDSYYEPRVEYLEAEGVLGFAAEIHLPRSIRSDCRMLRGPICGSARGARRAAALRLVRLLHANGELDDNLKSKMVVSSGVSSGVSDQGRRRLGRKKFHRTVRSHGVKLSCSFKGSFLSLPSVLPISSVSCVSSVSSVSCVLPVSSLSTPTQLHISTPTPIHISTPTELHISTPTETHISTPTLTSIMEEKSEQVSTQSREDVSVKTFQFNLIRLEDEKENRVLAVAFITFKELNINKFDFQINSRDTIVDIITTKSSIKLNKQSLIKITKFHFDFFKAVLRSKFDLDSDFATLCIPLLHIEKHEYLNLENRNPLDLIDFNALDYNATADLNDKSCLREANFGDFILYDQVRYRRNYILLEQLDITPLDPIQLPKYLNLNDFYRRRLKCDVDIDPLQKLIRAIPSGYPYHCRSKTVKFQEVFLVPQLSTISPLLKIHLKEALYYPLLMKQLSHISIVKEILPNFDISLTLLLEACTTPSANLFYNYERLETLGDAFLKVHLTLHLFIKHPNRQEGFLSAARKELENNNFLRTTANTLSLEAYIMSNPFSRQHYVPLMNSLDTQLISDKTVADVVEAIIGGSFVHNGMIGASKAIAHFLGADFHPWDQYDPTSSIPPTLDYDLLHTCTAIQSKIGYEFKDMTLLSTALTHISAILGGASYERLEYLGDSILGFVVTTTIFKIEPPLAPGPLSDLRSELVNNQFLAAVSTDLGLHRAFNHMSVALETAISNWTVPFLSTLGEVEMLEDADSLLFWNAMDTAPKVLGDLYESIVGAVFVDSGFDLEVVDEFVNRTIFGRWWGRFEPLLIDGKGLQSKHPMRELLDLMFEYKCHATEQMNTGMIKCLFLLHGKLLGEATKEAKKGARKAAAFEAVKCLKQTWLTTLQSECDCIKIQERPLDKEDNEDDEEEELDDEEEELDEGWG